MDIVMEMLPPSVSNIDVLLCPTHIHGWTDNSDIGSGIHLKIVNDSTGNTFPELTTVLKMRDDLDLVDHLFLKVCLLFT